MTTKLLISALFAFILSINLCFAEGQAGLPTLMAIFAIIGFLINAIVGGFLIMIIISPFKFAKSWSKWTPFIISTSLTLLLSLIWGADFLFLIFGG